MTDRPRGTMELLRSDDPVYSAKVGAIVVGVIALLLLVAITQRVPFVGKSGTVVRAEFSAANQITDLTPVRVDGVEVGRVESLERGSAAGTAIVKMRVTNDDVVIHRDARAEVRWRTVLGGNMFIDLEPGSTSAPELGDAVIPVSRTFSQIELDDLTQIYDQGTGEAQRAMLRGLRDTFAAPDAVGRTLESAGPALQTLGRGLQPLRGRNADDLPRLVAATANTLDGLGRSPLALQDLVAGADRTLAVPAAQRRDLGELITVAPDALDSTRTTMLRLRTTLEHLDPVVARLRVAAPGIAPAANAATPALGRTRALLHDLHPLLRAAGPTFTALRGASRSGVPLLQRLDPTIDRLNDELLPYLNERDASTRLRNYQAIGPFFSSLATVAAPFNDAGHLLQFAVLFGVNSALLPDGGVSRALAPAVQRCQEILPARSARRCTAAGRMLTRMFGGSR